MRRSSLYIARADVFGLFDQSARKVFDANALSQILDENRTGWNVARSTTTTRFIEFLTEQGQLRKTELRFPHRPLVRYIWDEASSFELAQSIKPCGYLSHFTAMLLHGLTEYDREVFYVNEEQRQGSPEGHLEQGRIDAAFKRPPRISANCAEHDGCTFYILNGKNTGWLGICEYQIPDHPNVCVTGLERTLIDIVVRPVYAGGVNNVLNAYRHAAGRVSVESLAKMLKSLQHVYPYHQAIGFYLEKSGCYSQSQLDVFRQLDMHYDFYLTHQMASPLYSKPWRIYYPHDL